MVRHPTIAALFWPQPHVWRSCSEQEELEWRREKSPSEWVSDQRQRDNLSVSSSFPVLEQASVGVSSTDNE